MLRFSDLEPFLLGVATAEPGNARPLNTGNNKTSYNLLAAQSALPQLSGQHTCGLGSTFLQQTVNDGADFFRVSCVSQSYGRVLVALM